MPEKHAKKLFANNLGKFWKFTFHRSPMLVVSKKCGIKVEKWAYINPDKSGYAFAEEQRNHRSFNSIFLFTIIIFVWIFFKDADFVNFISVDFF